MAEKRKYTRKAKIETESKKETEAKKETYKTVIVDKQAEKNQIDSTLNKMANNNYHFVDVINIVFEQQLRNLYIFKLND